MNENDNDSNANGYDEQAMLFNQRELIIFLIDSTDKMFQQDSMYFRRCLQCVRFTYLNAVRNSWKDLISIILFGTQSKDSGDQNPKFITTFSEASPPTVKIIKELRSMIDEPDYASTFKSSYGHSNDYSIADAFWHCSSIITRSKYKTAGKTIYLMTCADNPHSDSPTKIYQAKKKALDLKSFDVKLELLMLGETFDVSLFYRDILTTVNSDDVCSAEQLQDVSDIDCLPDCITRKRNYKRSIGTVPFYIGPDVFIGVEIYSFVRRRSLIKSTRLESDENALVKSVRETYDVESGEILLKSDINKYCEVGGERISCSMDEMSKLNNLSVKPALKLLGFKSMRYIDNLELFYYRPAYFIFPSENAVRGSKLLFVELLSQCLSKNKFALASLVARVRSKPRLVCLLPQKQTVSDNNREVQVPNGFHVFCLPYAENIRDPPLKELSSVSTEQQDFFNRLVRKASSSSFTSTIFYNPKLERHWNNMESLGIHGEQLNFVDNVQANHESLSDRLECLESSFPNLFNIQQPVAKTVNKRKAASNSSERNADEVKSKKKFEKNNDEIPLERYTVVQLRSLLKEKAIKFPGNCTKQDLINIAKENSLR